MTDAEIRIEIAQACGWRPDQANIGPAHQKVNGWWHNAKFHVESQLDDYPNDLNAMHEAWKTLDDYTKREFHVQLGLIIEKKRKEWNLLQLLDQRGLIANATARQRAEAFLRTIGKWKD